MRVLFVGLYCLCVWLLIVLVLVVCLFVFDLCVYAGCLGGELVLFDFGFFGLAFLLGLCYFVYACLLGACCFCVVFICLLAS